MPYSQYKQDEYCINTFFKGNTDGVFVEVGADDGIRFSNTKMMEEMGWTGLCIEPRPAAFAQLVKNRTCVCEQKAVAAGEPSTMDFLALEGYGKGLSGLVDFYDPKHVQRIERDKKRPEHIGSEVIQVDVVPLQQLLDTHGLTHVNFMSVDTEGSELSILQSIDWNRTRVDVIIVENNYKTKDVCVFLKKKGYTKHAKLGVDDIYVHSSLGFWQNRA